jgi:hypothetical protein
MMAVYNT